MMKTRLGIFVATLLLLPVAGLFLSGGEWADLNLSAAAENFSIWALPVCILVLAGYILLINQWMSARTGNNPLQVQQKYYLALAGTSVVLCWLLVYVDLFAASWNSQQAYSAVLLSIFFALLVPAVSITRAGLGSLQGLLKAMSGQFALPEIASDTLAYTLLPIAALGLLVSAVWPGPLFWLIWLAPLLLLVALQLLWHENTVFVGLKSGDWGRVSCAVIAGLIVGNLAEQTYFLGGGELIINLPHALFVQFGLALFGLLCLQIGDVIAEPWLGKKRSDVFLKKKKFPIPVVVKKN